MRDPMVEIGLKARALAKLGMVSGAWVNIIVDGAKTMPSAANGHAR